MLSKINKKKLSIKILDESDEEEQNKQKHFKNIKEKSDNLIENLEMTELSKIHLDEKVFEFNPDIHLLIDYMEGRNKELDESFIWITNLNSINKLSKCIYFSPKSWEVFQNTRDFEEEFKLLKMITEDDRHKENMIQISKNILNGNNRYKDILPCIFLI